MTTEVNVVLDSSAKKVKFEDVAVGICELNRSLVLIL